MEPNLGTDPKIVDVLKELTQREPIFHRLEFGSTRADFESMTEATFWEVGASGRRYSGEYVLDELEKRSVEQAEDARHTFRDAGHASSILKRRRGSFHH